MAIKSPLFSWYNPEKPTERLIAGLLLLASLVLLVVITWLSDGIYTGSDNIMHYQIAHFSWKHPELFLHHWGKPLFTLFSSSLAQFGFFGARLFNILAGLATAWLAYLTVSRLGFRNSYMVIIFVVFAPMYFMMQMTSLTEILFSFVLMLSVYLYFTDSLMLSAIVLSFLPLARTEGIIILPIFGLAYLLRRKWWAIPLLATGFIVYSLAGWHYYHDFLWLINQNPYNGAKELYGTGSLLHFAKDTKSISGFPLAFLMLAGLLYIGWTVFKSSKADRRKSLNILWIIFVPYAVYFIFHSILWWKGMGGSAGLTRVIAAVLPLACIISFLGFQAVMKLLSFSRLASVFFLVAITFLIIRTTFKVNNVPVKLETADKVVKETADWIFSEKMNSKMIYYYDPQVSFFLDLDPWDATTNRAVIFDGGLNMNLLAENSLLIWDAHFGPNEGNAPLDTLLNQHSLQLLKVFRPDQPFTVMGGYNYEIYVFKRLPANNANINNRTIIHQMDAAQAAQSEQKTLLTMDFESGSTDQQKLKLTRESAYSGKSSYKLSSTDEYGPGSSSLLSVINPANVFPMRIEASVYVFAKQKSATNQVSLVISCEKEGKPYLYQTADLGTTVAPGKWTKLSTWVNMQECKSSSDIIKVYVWHRGKDEMLLDDFSAELILRKGK